MNHKSQKEMLTDRQKLYCHWYVLTGDAVEAAVLCYPRPTERTAAESLLRTSAAQEYLAAIRKRASTAGERNPDVLDGYRRLAFGSISDAVKLMFVEEDAPPDIDRLDLFNVSELRKGKGGLEISFFDRLDALDRLAHQQTEDEGRDTMSFYEAVREGAAALEGKE